MPLKRELNSYDQCYLCGSHIYSPSLIKSYFRQIQMMKAITEHQQRKTLREVQGTLVHRRPKLWMRVLPMTEEYWSESKWAFTPLHRWSI